MLVGAVGYNYRHRKDFIMDCPHGVGCPLILLIKEPSVFVINGIEHRAEKKFFYPAFTGYPCEIPCRRRVLYR